MSSAVAAPFAIGCVLCALVIVPRFAGWLDAALALLTLAVLAQLIPWPDAMVSALSGQAALVRDALAFRARGTSGVPLTIDGRSTALAALELLGTIALFVTAREIFKDGGVRRVVAAVAVAGLVISVLGLLQAAAGHARAAPFPFGPFRNRNYFATWAIMALPLCVGYLAAQSRSRQQPPARTVGGPVVVERSAVRTLWLTTTVAVLLVALVLSLSRSAVAALAAVSVVTLALSRRSMGVKAAAALVVTLALMCAAAFGWHDDNGVRQRIGGSTPPDLRATIWRETAPLVRDFWIAGTGAGTYELAMRAYQQSDRSVYFNQAQNQYVQLAAEGGLLLTVPAAFALLAFAVTARSRLSRDDSRLRWIRIGAACGLAAAAFHGVWECGLTASANAALAAVLAAIVVHERN